MRHTEEDQVVATISSSDCNVQTRFRETSAKLIESMRAVIESLADRPTRAVEIERSLGIGRNIAHRFARALNEPDIIEAIHLGPGPVPLRQILRASQRRGAARQLVSQARAALREFEQMIEQHAGDRSTLDVMMGGWLPPVRDRTELLARQSIHRGFSHIRGCSARFQLALAFIHPSQTDPAAADGLICELLRNIVRLREGARVRCGSLTRLAAPGISGPYTLDGRAVESPQDVLLSPWSTMSPDAFRFERAEQSAWIELADNRLGVSMPVDVALAMRHDACINLTRRADVAPGAGPVVDMQLPAEQLVFDVYVHESLFPGQTPRLVMRDPAADRALPKTTRYRSDLTMFEIDAHFAPLSRSRAALKWMSDYDQLLAEVAEKTRWPLDDFRSYRATIRYPIYGSLIHAYFDRRIVE